MLAGVVSTSSWVLRTTTKLPTSDKHMPLKNGCRSLQLNTSFVDHWPTDASAEAILVIQIQTGPCHCQEDKNWWFLNICLERAGREGTCVPRFPPSCLSPHQGKRQGCLNLFHPADSTGLLLETFLQASEALQGHLPSFLNFTS